MLQTTWTTIQTFTRSRDFTRWLVAFAVAFTSEAVIFCLLFFFQNAEYINTPEQKKWLTSYGSTTLVEFVWQKFIWFEAIRRLPWIVIGLGLVLFATRFPILGNAAGRVIHRQNLLCHIAAGLGISLLHGVVVQNTLTMLFGRAAEEMFPFYVYLRNFNGLFLSLLHYILIVTVVSMVNYHRQYRMEELRAARLETTTAQLETDLAQAQLQALKMQLHPHFLFNALNSISALLYNNPRRADTMIARLGDFLRMTLENPTTQFITLKQELDLLRCYVDIEMMRFPSRLHVEMSIETGLQDAELPNLLLQPLVENSIKYGILQSTNGGRIDISARRLPSAPSTTLEIIVRDNGPGIQPVEQARNVEGASNHAYGTLRKKSSIGLQNTRSRLEKLYGAHFRFDAYNAPEGGFVVYMEIPLRFFTAEQDSMPLMGSEDTGNQSTANVFSNTESV